MEIYIVRHGETVWNKRHRLQGNTDIALNENGKRLALESGRNLKDTEFDVVYCSPLKRARETAELMMQGRSIDIIPDNRIREMNFGILEGRNVDEMRLDKTNPFYPFFDNPQDYEPDEGGETIEEVVKRGTQFMQQVVEPLEKQGKKRVMLVAHGAMNKAIMMYIKKHDKKDFWSGGLQKNCNVMLVDYTDGVYRVMAEEKLFYKN